MEFMPRKRRNKAQLYEIMSQAIAYLREQAPSQPKVEEVAQVLGMSPAHFNQVFAQWVGITPRRFLHYLTKERAKVLLRQSKDVLEVSYRAGLSGPGRLHELLVTYEAVSPGEFKTGEITIHFGLQPSPFGYCLLGVTARGICHLSFLETDDEYKATQLLREAWPSATLVRDEAKVKPYLKQLFGVHQSQQPLPLLLKGTNFQIKVWEALLAIPTGQVASYADIAHLVGSPKAVRAVGKACGQNPVGFIIPCHRVLTSQGQLGGYHWGVARKEAILAWEAVRS